MTLSRRSFLGALAAVLAAPRLLVNLRPASSTTSRVITIVPVQPWRALRKLEGKLNEVLNRRGYRLALDKAETRRGLYGHVTAVVDTPTGRVVAMRRFYVVARPTASADAAALLVMLKFTTYQTFKAVDEMDATYGEPVALPRAAL